MMKWEISSNDEAYTFTDVSYFSRFNRDIYDTLEKSATGFGLRYAT